MLTVRRAVRLLAVPCSIGLLTSARSGSVRLLPLAGGRGSSAHSPGPVCRPQPARPLSRRRRPAPSAQNPNAPMWCGICDITMEMCARTKDSGTWATDQQVEEYGRKGELGIGLASDHAARNAQPIATAAPAVIAKPRPRRAGSLRAWRRRDVSRNGVLTWSTAHVRRAYPWFPDPDISARHRPTDAQSGRAAQPDLGNQRLAAGGRATRRPTALRSARRPTTEHGAAPCRRAAAFSPGNSRHRICAATLTPLRQFGFLR